MARSLRSSDEDIYLIVKVNHQITGSKLPSNQQVLSVLFYNIREVNLTISESAKLVTQECMIFWAKARIPTRALQHCVKKIVELHSEWRNLQKNSHRSTNVCKEREQNFIQDLNNLFDIAHAYALEMIKIEEDKCFLIKQREPGRQGCLGGVDMNLARKEERSMIRNIKEKERQVNIKPTDPNNPQTMDISEASSGDSGDNIQHITDNSETENLQKNVCKRGRKNFMTSKLVAALDRCQLSQRDSVFVLEAAAEALGHNVDDLAINRNSIQRCREKLRKQQAERIKDLFKEKDPSFVTVHWDGKLLPALNVRDSKTERLPIIITYEDQEQLLGVPTLPNATGKEQSLAVWNALQDWGLDKKVQILCSDTTVSNTGRINGTVIRLEHLAGREMLYFPCRHHIYELVLQSVFENEFTEGTSSPDIVIFKTLRMKWKSINKENFQDGKANLHEAFCDKEIEETVSLFRRMLKERELKNDYRELIELCLIFLGANVDSQLKIRPPGALHHARWMAKAIYIIKMFLYRYELSLSPSDENSMRNICLFLVKIYVKSWMNVPAAIGAPNNDLNFLKL